jgi:hypothetical protein
MTRDEKTRADALPYPREFLRVKVAELEATIRREESRLSDESVERIQWLIGELRRALR